jgi:hypothetical protein
MEKFPRIRKELSYFPISNKEISYLNLEWAIVHKEKSIERRNERPRPIGIGGLG